MSLFITSLLFAAFAALSYTVFFDFVENRFYNPATERTLRQEITRDTQSAEDFFTDMEGRFSSTLEEEAVRRSFLPNQHVLDILERERLYGLLLEDCGGLQWVRFVDAGGRRIHYSTLPSDMLRRDEFSAAYRNYDALSAGFSFRELAVRELDPPRFILDPAKDRIIFSAPFYDFQEVYRGTALFSFSVEALREHLAASGRINIGEEVFLAADPPGLVIALPHAGRDVLLSLIASLWNREDGVISAGTKGKQTGSTGAFTVFELEDSGKSLVLNSSQTFQGIYIGRLVDESLLTFSSPMKALLLLAFFCTVYLTIFFFFNLRQDPLTIIRSRLQNLRSALLDEYESRREGDWNSWSRELDRRREDIRSEIMRDIPMGNNARYKADLLINRFWDELVAVTRSRSGAPIRDAAVIDEGRLRETMKKILLSMGIGGNQASASSSALSGEAEILEVLESVEDTEEVEELEGVETMDGEDIGELEELEEEEKVEELEALEEEPAAAAMGADEIASQIEFSPLEESEDTGEESLEELEIVSPFASMLSEFDQAGKQLETLTVSASLLYTPFEAGGAPSGTITAAQDDGIIETREGVSYVNEKALRPGEETEAALDPRFKGLIKSVLENNAAPAP